MSNDKTKSALVAAASVQRDETDKARSRLSPEDFRDLITVVKLRERLRELTPEGSLSTSFDRRTIVTILEAIAEAVGAIMETSFATDDIVVVVEHPTSQLVAELAKALGDLDHGLVDERLKRKNVGGTARYNSRQKDTIDSCLEFVDMYQMVNCVTQSEAEKRVSVYLGRMGVKVRDKRITPTWLKSWRRSRPGSR
ncbi:MAG: hypothetical protein EXR07_02075 [Acetobacteraceae bacterium]|nr:hypothetical protein [Acetobacteraceae bacterium]